MGIHDDYGQRVLREATSGSVERYGPGVEIDYGTDHPARIDGAFGNSIAIEVESRTGKQVRGAVLDLICHPYPKKLLVLLPMYMSSAVPDQCRNILARFCRPDDFRVVLLRGTGKDSQLEWDAALVAEALRELKRPNGSENGKKDLRSAQVWDKANDR